MCLLTLLRLRDQIYLESQERARQLQFTLSCENCTGWQNEMYAIVPNIALLMQLFNVSNAAGNQPIYLC